MKLYGHPMSTCTRKVLCTLAEKGVEAEFKIVDIMKGEQKSPDHLARQPFGVVPVLEDDGFAMYESRAIIRYLDAKLPGAQLTPSDLRERAVMDQWISIEQSNFTPAVLTLMYQLLFGPMQGKQPDAAVVDGAKAKAGVALDVAAKHLEGKDFFTGKQFTLADVCWAPYVELLFAMSCGDLITSRPAFAAWWERVGSRPSWKKAAGK